VVAILLWGLLIEDFLTPNRLTLDEFCDDFIGSWVFGYADALRTAGVETVIVAVSSSVAAASARRHRATGTEIVLLPPPRLYRILRRAMRAPQARTASATFRGPRVLQLPLLPLLWLAKELAPYVSMPARTLGEELQRRSCSVLLCQEYEFPRFDVCVALARMRHLRVFGVFQGGDYQRWRLERVIRPFAISRADGLIIPSAAEVARVRRRYRPRTIARIPNPVDVDVWRAGERRPVRRELGIADDALVAAWHGRVDLWKKGLDTLVDAWAAVSKQRDDAVLLLIGTGVDADALKARIARHGLENVVWIDRHLHQRETIARLLGCADVYAFTSRHEGFPVAPVEAMACGLPVVATGVSGIRDVLADGEASGGVIVPVEDAEQVARQLLRLFADDVLRGRLAVAARRKAEEYGLETVGRGLRTVLFDGAA
jgi:glycosyltransferase involved in cell wall biosynthesis